MSPEHMVLFSTSSFIVSDRGRISDKQMGEVGIGCRHVSGGIYLQNSKVKWGVTTAWYLKQGRVVDYHTQKKTPHITSIMGKRSFLHSLVSQLLLNNQSRTNISWQSVKTGKFCLSKATSGPETGCVSPKWKVFQNLKLQTELLDRILDEDVDTY